MTEPVLGHEVRPLPRFFAEWRSGWGESAKSWEPVDYLNQSCAVSATITAGWLFNPSTVEYRERIFLADRFDAKTVDRWFDEITENPARVEAVVNQLTLFDFFANCDLDRYEDSLSILARDIGTCWQAVLTSRYPGRTIYVQTDDGSDQSPMAQQ